METFTRGHLQFDDPAPQRIAIVRALPGLGDLLCSVPAFRALRLAFPTAEITLVGLPWAKSFVQRFHDYLDHWLEFPGYPSIPEVPLSPQRTIAFLQQIQQAPLDLALQMHGNGSTMNGFTRLLGAKHTAGFFPGEQVCPDVNRFLPYPEQLPEVHRHLQLLEFLGIPAQDDSLEFPVSSRDRSEAEAILQAYELQSSFVCIHPGASTADRRWACEHFAVVADALAAQDYRVVLTGTAGEKDLTQKISQLMQHPAIDLAGQTSLGALALLLQEASLLICNDTGVSHLGAAVRVKSVVIFSQSEPHRWAPLDRDRHRIVAMPSIENAHLYPAATPMQVLREALHLLHQEVSYAS
ncbi:glycosyltransferase family 9 protein [Leptolyngbya ohadii]|uniref:glycosyltransferase family 9 protein n=1 Tax=Leptolyngbya ohadii TaxID=1962290 RepID=UPI000B59A031|nr:glycosyltransferase family 9 protein [Leptolyngbya ohadii]